MMCEVQVSRFDRDEESAAAAPETDSVREQTLEDFRQSVARLIGPFAEMARLLSPVDPSGTVFERGDKVLEVRHFNGLRTLFETLNQAGAAKTGDGGALHRQRR